MTLSSEQRPEILTDAESRAEPLCPVFGQCGGCQYQDLTYPAELKLKSEFLRERLRVVWPGGDDALIQPIVASPEFFHYRHVLDLKLVRKRSGEVEIGFSPVGRNRIIPVESCPISMRAVSDFLPQLRQKAAARLTPRYRNANLVVKTGDDGRAVWGGIGRRSLQLAEKDYLWTEIEGKRIFYSLDTFFQANLSILPDLIKRITGLSLLDRDTVFYDLYGGVGLFGVLFAQMVRRVILIEDNRYAVKLADYNRRTHRLENFHIIRGRVEDRLSRFPEEKNVVLVDPPRAGLSRCVIELLSKAPRPRTLLYLSCNPDSFGRDASFLNASGWMLNQVIPFDFFPRTMHLEILGVFVPSE